MLIKFHSHAAPEVLMVDRHAQQALSLLGKSASQGCLTVAELETAIQVLETAVSESKQHGLSHALTQDAAAQRQVLGRTTFMKRTIRWNSERICTRCCA